MRDYQVPQEETSMDFQYWMDYVADQQRYPAHHDDADHTDYSPLQPMQPCRNLDCTNRSYAIFCSEACRIVLEGPEETETAYYSNGEGVLLGHRQLSDDQAALDGDLVRRALGMPQAAPAVAAPIAAPTFTEAPISITLKGLVHGQDTMVTIRGVDFAQVQAQVEAASQWLDTPAVQSTQGETEPAHLCPVHGVPMTQQTNAKGAWWSHRTASGWCKGRKAA